MWLVEKLDRKKKGFSIWTLRDPSSLGLGEQHEDEVMHEVRPSCLM